MANGVRVTHAVTAVGQSTAVLTGSWANVLVTNWGTVPLQVVAQVSSLAAPTLVWNNPDQDIVPVGGSKNVVVVGPEFDPGNPGEVNVGVTVYVVNTPGTANSPFTVEGANG